MVGSADAEYHKKLVNAIVHIGVVICHDCGAASQAEFPSPQAVGTEAWLLDGGVACYRLVRWYTDAGLRGFKLRGSRAIFGSRGRGGRRQTVSARSSLNIGARCRRGIHRGCCIAAAEWNPGLGQGGRCSRQ
jgi:hypothetical protein